MRNAEEKDALVKKWLHKLEEIVIKLEREAPKAVADFKKSAGTLTPLFPDHHNRKVHRRMESIIGRINIQN
ncbi:MAG: hypothetical protein ACYTFY_13320 [Planctomycetota bacterium]|jgi:hypothetical protein